tara:strand:+ start:956 stop:1429 length:474 start_codon:yes stop_codon:yes gene_type:complete
MATYKTDLATSQEAALLDSSALANDGTTHTGVLKVSTARVTLTGGIASGNHTFQGLLLPPGARVIPNLCDVLVNVESGLDYNASIVFRDAASGVAPILQTSYDSTGTPNRKANHPRVTDADVIAPQTQSQWIDVEFEEQNGTSNNLIIEIIVGYVGI